MWTWQLAQFGRANLGRVARPEPTLGTDEILLRVRAVALNYRDLLIVSGQYNPRLKLPRILGSDGAGEIVAVGPNVTNVRIGDRVCASFMPRWLDGPIHDAVRGSFGADLDGLLTEYAVLPSACVVPTPPHLTDDEAATLPCAAVTAWNALAEGGVRPGETVLVQGTGGVALFALQFARVLGARVLLTSGSDTKMQRALQLGAAAVVNYRTTPDWDQWAKSQTNGVGVDHIVEVGGAGTLERSFKAVRTGGHIALIGVLAGGQPINPMPIIMRALRVRGIFVGSRAMFVTMNDTITRHQLHPVIDRAFPFEQLPDALAYLESAVHFGKIVVRV